MDAAVRSHIREREKNNPPLLTFRCFSRSHLYAISKSERLEQVIIGPTRMWFSLSLWLFCPCIERVRLRTFRVPLLSRVATFGGRGGGASTLGTSQQFRENLETFSLTFDYRDRCLITITGRQSTLNDMCIINIVFKLHSLSPPRRPLRLALGKKKPS